MLYRLIFRLVLARIDPERAHRLAGGLLRAVTGAPPLRAALRTVMAPHEQQLVVRTLGLEFPSPVGVAAGLDKDATWFAGLAALGFGFVEVGTVTAQPQGGNRRPRVRRLPADRALVNSMGFPNDGAAAVAARLARRRAGGPPIGVNIGRSRAAGEDGALADYRESVRLLAPHADYLVVNVSSPNTPGLRALQEPGRLRPLLDAVTDELARLPRRVPLLVKIDPDLRDERIDAICDLVLQCGLDGIVAVNTTLSRDGLSDDAADLAGGLSGPPLAARSLAVLRRIRARVGDELVVMSVGGVTCAEDVAARLRAGATLVQVYTAFVYGGPLYARRLTRKLARRLDPADS